MEILEAYDLTECAWSAARLAGVDAKTIARYVQVRDAGGDPFASVRRPRLIDPFLANVEQMVDLSECQVRANVVHERLVAMGFGGDERSTRRAVAELFDAEDAHRRPTGGRTAFYRVLRDLEIFGPTAPCTLRALSSSRQRTPEELIDRFGLVSQPIRDLLVDYLRERQPALDYTSLEALVADLTDAITTWAEYWNTDPTPFIWKATAEDIITKVQRGRETLHRSNQRRTTSAIRWVAQVVLARPCTTRWVRRL